MTVGLSRIMPSWQVVVMLRVLALWRRFSETGDVVSALEGPSFAASSRVHPNKLYPVFFLLFSMKPLLTSSSLYTVHYRSPFRNHPVALFRSHFLAFYRTITRFFFGPGFCTGILGFDIKQNGAHKTTLSRASTHSHYSSTDFDRVYCTKDKRT